MCPCVTHPLKTAPPAPPETGPHDTAVKTKDIINRRRVRRMYKRRTPAQSRVANFCLAGTAGSYFFLLRFWNMDRVCVCVRARQKRGFAGPHWLGLTIARPSDHSITIFHIVAADPARNRSA